MKNNSFYLLKAPYYFVGFDPLTKSKLIVKKKSLTFEICLFANLCNHMQIKQSIKNLKNTISLELTEFQN